MQLGHQQTHTVCVYIRLEFSLECISCSGNWLKWRGYQRRIKMLYLFYVNLFKMYNAGTIEEQSPHLQLWAQTSQHRCSMSGRAKFIESAKCVMRSFRRHIVLFRQYSFISGVTISESIQYCNTLFSITSTTSCLLQIHF